MGGINLSIFYFLHSVLSIPFFHLSVTYESQYPHYRPFLPHTFRDYCVLVAPRVLSGFDVPSGWNMLGANSGMCECRNCHGNIADNQER